jgi:FkbM family methyltransferase
MSAYKFYGQFEPQVDRFIFERYFPNVNIQGVFVECGAFDGVTESSCKFFEDTMGWKGFNLEPVPWIYEKLVDNRPDAINLNLALSNQSGSASFKAVNHPVFGYQCTNGSLAHVDEHKQTLIELGCNFKEVHVSLIGWKEFVKEHGVTHVDLFVLDVEGHELTVIDGMKGCDVLPDIMCVEFGHIGIDKVRAEMQTLGYVYDITSNANAFFIRQDVLNLFSLRHSIGYGDSSNLTSNQLKIENEQLLKQVAELQWLYDEMVASKVWRIVEFFRRLCK